MPTLNTKLLLRLLAAALVLGSGLAVLHHVQAARVPDALLWQADAALEKGKTDKAILYLRQYLEFRPDDHHTAVRLADLMLQRAGTSKDVANAQFLYERVLREAPHRQDVARKLVGLCLRMRRYADALEHARRLREQAPQDGLLRAQIAECLAATNQPDEARAEFEAAIALAPDGLRAYELLADLLGGHFKRPQEAGAVLDRLTRANPSDPAAFLARARYLRRADRGDDCLRDLDRVFLLDPENAEALVMNAELLQARGDLRRAKETLRDTVALYPRYAHGYRALAWLELLSGNEADARATLEHGVEALPTAPELLTPLADLWVGRGELDRVAGVIGKLEAMQTAAPPDGKKEFALRVGYLRARVLMGQAKWVEALPVLEGLRTEAVAQPALAAQVNLLIAACHERRGDRDARVESLKRVITIDPQHLGARVALANTYLGGGRFDEALKEYQTAARSPYAGIGVLLAYADLRLSLARQGNTADDEWKALGTFLGKAREQHPLAVEPVVLLAEWRLARGDAPGAEKVLREAAASRPGDPRLWSALAGLLGRTRGTLAATAAVGEGQLAAGESVELRLARARAWADDLQPGRDRRLATLEDLPPGAGDAERTRLLTGLAELYVVIHDEAGQKRVRTVLAALSGQDVESRKVLYALALRGGDAAGQARWRDELRKAEGPAGQSVAVLDALHALAGATAGDRRLAEWQNLARGVLATQPDQTDAHLLLARSAERAGDAPTAARHFELAADLDPTDVRYQEARLGYYLRAGQDDLARKTLARLESDPRISPTLFRAVVEGAIAQGGSDGLRKCLAAIQTHIQREPRAAVWAGRLLEGRGKVTEALALYRQATDAHPAFADGWSARLLASARLGEPEVNETMAQAGKALDRQAFFEVCAECGSAVRAKVPGWAPPVNSPEDRRVYAQACISACEARGRLADAVPVLSAIAKDPESGKEEAAWARRTLAALTAALGVPDQKRDAVSALRDAGGAPTSVEDARGRLAALTVAYRSVGGDDRRVVTREMIGLLSGIVRDPAATSNDWYQLAQLHRVAGDRAGCRKCLEELTRREPRNLFYLAVSVDDLLSDNRLDDARPLVERLKEGVADFRVLSSAARFHTRAGDPAAVLDLVERFVRVADPGTTDGAVRQRQAADLLDQLSRQAAGQGLPAAKPLLAGACERYRASLRAYPEAVVPMAALLAFHGQIDPAFDELERHRARLSPTVLATAGVAVLRSGHASPKQFQTVKGWIEEALAAEPNSLALRLNLGELHALRQDFATAEQVYRDVLKADPKNAVALNNLAWILAPRPESADQALRFADRAIELSGATGELLDTRARILISAGQYDRAVADLTDAINQGGSPLRYFHLALARLKMAKDEEALKAFREARARGLEPKAVHPHDLPAYKALADRADQ